MQITSTLPSRPIILQLKVYVKLFASWSVRWGSRRNLEIHQAKSVSLCHLVAKNTRRAGCIWWRVLTPPDTPLEKSRLVHSWKQSKAGSKAIRCIFTLHVFMLWWWLCLFDDLWFNFLVKNGSYSCNIPLMYLAHVLFWTNRRHCLLSCLLTLCSWVFNPKHFPK